MNLVARCPVCDLKALTVHDREQAIVVALDMGAKRGADGVQAVLCEGHRRNFEGALVNGMTALAEMIRAETAQAKREGGR